MAARQLMGGKAPFLSSATRREALFAKPGTTNPRLCRRSVCSGSHSLKLVNHSCLTCQPGADRVIDYENNAVNLPQHFRGPPTSGNGGVATGLYACLGAHFLETNVAQLQVKLHQPVPLSTDLDFDEEQVDNETVSVTVGINGETVLSGWASSRIKEPVMSEDTALELQRHVALSEEQKNRFDSYEEVFGPSKDHFAECFVCGPESRLGLRLRLRQITDQIFWQTWNPGRRWEDQGVLASLPAIAALDCTSALGFYVNGFLGEHESCLLGTYDAAVTSLPLFDSEEGFRVISKTRERVGRKIYTDVGLFGATGEVHVLGKATWIVVSPEVAKG